MDTCPCGSSENYKTCCQPLHQGTDVAPTALKLMQSRYCAYVVKAYDYLKLTTDPQTTFEFDHNANQEWGDRVQFQKLEILSSEEIKNKATVEFKAHFLDNHQLVVHHEVSRFRRLEGIWYFRDGKVKN